MWQQLGDIFIISCILQCDIILFAHVNGSKIAFPLALVCSHIYGIPQICFTPFVAHTCARMLYSIYKGNLWHGVGMQLGGLIEFLEQKQSQSATRKNVKKKYITSYKRFSKLSNTGL